MSALIVVAFLIGLAVGHMLTDSFGFWRKQSRDWRELATFWREQVCTWRRISSRWQELAQDSVKLSGELVGDLQRTKHKLN